MSQAEAETPAELCARVRAYIADDLDPVSRRELEQLLAQNELPALRERFAGELEFGTAGLRGELGAGPMRMNRAVVARASYGVCAHLAVAVRDAAQRGLCIGFDGRHMSREFAEESAAVAAAMGFRVKLFERPVPTPVLGYAVLAEDAAGGIMVTASHNPARDNGYKVYFENGAQIVPPHDVAIAKAMRELTSVAALARMPASERRAQGRELTLGDAIEARYLAAVRALTHTNAPARDAAELCIAYTALHGVGERFVRPALAQAGFTKLHSVSEQAEPDPDFPTVAFPNPEEKGAMDRVLELGERVRADLVVANDPDADRLALAARDAQGKLRALTGNQIGVLLAEHLLSADHAPGERAVLSSIVSTPLIAAIARAHDAVWEPTLTGFKWICDRAMTLARERGTRFIFGFEEALGYSPGTLVRDKDGVSSAVVAAQLAAAQKAGGKTLFDALETLYRKHGVYASGQISLRLEGIDGPAKREALMSAAREQALQAIAGLAVTAAIDLASGAVAGKPSFAFQLPKSDVLLWELEGGQRVIVRPSGTEPKVKIYLDVCTQIAEDEALKSAEARAQALLGKLGAELRVILKA